MIPAPKPKAVLRILPLLATVAGCGGAEVGGTTPPISYADYAAIDAAMRAANASSPFTDPVALPASGTAAFSGVVTLTAGTGSGPLQLSGALNAAADFSASTLTGQARGFVDGASAGYGGVLALSNGLIDRGADPATRYSVTADLAGTLSGAAGSFGIAAVLSGDFLGTGYTALRGAIAGVATGPGGADYLYGDFIATR